MEGFFPICRLNDRPIEAASGLQEFGLPYASDPSITKHLAEFLWDHRWAGRDDVGDHAPEVAESTEAIPFEERMAARPDFILFNGGVLEATRIRERLLAQLVEWFAIDASGAKTEWQPGVLEGNRLDLAVALGAAYYGLVRRGEGVRIDASLARAYFLHVQEDPPQAMCIVRVMRWQAMPFAWISIPFS